jgi:hypothetical protein
MMMMMMVMMMMMQPLGMEAIAARVAGKEVAVVVVVVVMGMPATAAGMMFGRGVGRQRLHLVCTQAMAKRARESLGQRRIVLVHCILQIGAIVKTRAGAMKKEKGRGRGRG